MIDLPLASVWNSIDNEDIVIFDQVNTLGKGLFIPLLEKPRSIGEFCVKVTRHTEQRQVTGGKVVAEIKMHNR
jgi:hypothetical protein